MKRIRLLLFAIVFAAVGGAGHLLWAQQRGEMVLYNGKIITVDDHSLTSRLGTIAQAIHIQDGKILHVGTNAQIRPMAGPNATVIDLKGRTVIPGFIETHEHPWDWNPVEPAVVKRVLTDDVVVTRFLQDSPEENLKAFPEVLAQAVKTAKPGQWIYIVFTFGKRFEYNTTGNGGFGHLGLDAKSFNVLDGKRITKEQIDQAAPNNPVVLRDVFTSMVLNQKAIDESRKVFSEPDVNPVKGGESGQNSSLGDPSTFRWFFGDVLMKDHHAQLVEVMRQGMEWWAGYGLTAFSSNAYTPSNLQVYGELDRQGRLPLRSMWSWNWRQNYFYSDPYFLFSSALNVGKGTDYLWFGGGRAVTGGGCTTMEPSPSSKLVKVPELQVKAREQQCTYAPGTKGEKLLYEWIKAGGRYVGNHTAGDGDIDNILRVIQKASKDAGMTDEEVRTKRHGVDHMVMWPRQDQIAPIQKLGILTSGDSFEVIEASPAVFDIYGERGVDQVVPRKRILDAGIMNSFEIDRALGTSDYTIFSAGIAPMIERKGWDGKVYGANQAVDRERALKIATYGGAYYLVREDVLGSLEPGKWADLVVLDRDYLTIPIEDIKNIRVLMTMVGGKIIHLAPSLAKDAGVRPVGPQALFGPAAQW